MRPDKSQSNLINSYLGGGKDANEFIESKIAAAYRSWEAKFGIEKSDIISDVRFELYTSLSNGTLRDESKLPAFIRSIVFHTCIDYIRRRKREHAVDLDSVILIDKNPSPDKEYEIKEMSEIGFRIIRLISKECRKLWRLHLLEGLKYREIAVALGDKEPNIRRKIYVCREQAKKIREKLLKNDKLF